VKFASWHLRNLLENIQNIIDLGKVRLCV
jgi:hypothetical protein